MARDSKTTDGATDSAKRAGKQAAKKTVGKIAKKVVSWLKKVLWEKPIEYIKLKGKKYLKLVGEKGKQKAQLVKEGDVPSKYQRETSEKLRQRLSGGSNRPRGDDARPRGRTPEKSAGSSRGSGRKRGGKPRPEPHPDPGRSPRNSSTGPRSKNSQSKPERSQKGSRPHRDDSVDPETIVDEEMEGDELPDEVKKQLEQAPPEVVAELAADNQRIRSYVLENPGLVDASSRKEAAQRIELMGGATADSLTEFNPGHGSDIEGLLDEMGPKWSARLGYNEMGEALPDALNEASGSDSGEASGDGDGGDSSVRAGGDICGTASGTVDTDAGSTSFSPTGSNSTSGSSSSGASNGIGNAGGAGNGISSGNGSGGTGR